MDTRDQLIRKALQVSVRPTGETHKERRVMGKKRFEMQGQRDIGYALRWIVIRASFGVDRRRNEISVSVHVKVKATPATKSRCRDSRVSLDGADKAKGALRSRETEGWVGRKPGVQWAVGSAGGGRTPKAPEECSYSRVIMLLVKAEVAHVASEVATEPEVETTRLLERGMERIRLATRLR